MTNRPMVTGATRISFDRPYSLALPGGARPARGFPLLLALHGFGETGERLAGRLAALDGAPYARLFPDAPFPVEVREPSGSRVGASWYQYTGDQPAFLRALEFAEGYLRDVVSSAGRDDAVDPNRVVILGYSQGGYLAGVAAFREPSRYLGLVGVACRIKTEALERELETAGGYPVLLIHGSRDQHTAAERQRAAHEDLVRRGVDSTLHVHDGGHGFRSDLAPMIDAFTRRVLGV